MEMYEMEVCRAHLHGKEVELFRELFQERSDISLGRCDVSATAAEQNATTQIEL